MRKTICRSNRLAVLVVGAVLAPATAAAQVDSAVARPDSARTAVHVVHRGDTLWDLAIQYLRDPFRWRAIHGANRDVVENPHRIYPGERLRIPGVAAPADAVASAPAGGRVTGIAGVGADSAVGTFVVPDVSHPVSAEAAEARRLADFLAAPYAERGDAPATGTIQPARSGAGDVYAADRWLTLGDEVRLTLPPGTTPAIGQRLLVAAEEERAAGGRIVRPTGIVEVEEFEGDRARGRVIVVMGLLRGGQRVLPLPAPPAERVGAATGAPVRIVWVASNSVLPSLQDWLLLEPAAGAAVGEQDEIELVRHPAGSDDPADVELLGRARVVRVTPLAASAYITYVEQPGIRVGTAGRVAAPR